MLISTYKPVLLFVRKRASEVNRAVATLVSLLALALKVYELFRGSGGCDAMASGR